MLVPAGTGGTFHKQLFFIPLPTTLQFHLNSSYGASGLHCMCYILIASLWHFCSTLNFTECEPMTFRKDGIEGGPSTSCSACLLSILSQLRHDEVHQQPAGEGTTFTGCFKPVGMLRPRPLEWGLRGYWRGSLWVYWDGSNHFILLNFI